MNRAHSIFDNTHWNCQGASTRESSSTKRSNKAFASRPVMSSPQAGAFAIALGLHRISLDSHHCRAFPAHHRVLIEAPARQRTDALTSSISVEGKELHDYQSSCRRTGSDGPGSIACAVSDEPDRDIGAVRCTVLRLATRRPAYARAYRPPWRGSVRQRGRYVRR